MKPVDNVSINDPEAETLPSALPPASSPDPGFSHMLDEETSRKPHLPEAPRTPEMAKFNVHNLFNGQFPPPDSGAGYLFALISLNENTF